jgi:hypothetical protein
LKEKSRDNTKLKSFIRNKRALTGQLAAIIIVIALIVSAFAYLGLTGQLTPGTTPAQPNNWGWGATVTPAPTQSSTGVGLQAAVRLEVVNSVTQAGVTTSTTTVDAVAAVGGVFNFLSGPMDTKAQAANPQAMNTEWLEGTELILMADCTGNPTNGLDFYPAMYYVKLQAGQHVYELDVDSFQLVSTSPYSYSINTANAKMLPNVVKPTVVSNVNYWNIGKLAMYPRQAIADMDIYLMYNGAELSKCTDGSTWDDDTTDMDANATLASDTETLSFQMVGANADLGWGKHFVVINQQGKVEEYGAVMVMTTAMTGMAVPTGWNSITMGTLYAEKGFYKVMNPDVPDADVTGVLFPTKGNKASWTVNIHIDATAATASTAYLCKFWIEDCQLLSNVPVVGTSTGVPSAYGFVTAYGVGAVNHNTALTVSSGAGETEQLCTYLTTAS